MDGIERRSRTMVNIGTQEAPCLVPEEALIAPQSPIGNAWWERVATGSVILSQEYLKKALEMSKNSGGSDGRKQG